MQKPNDTVSITIVEKSAIDEESLKLVENEILTKTPSHYEDGLRYDPVVITEYYQQRPLKVLWRFLSIFIPFVNFLFSQWLDKKRGNVIKNQRKRAIQLREMITNLGPAFIKVGQALSTRPDLVAPIFLEELTKLQDQLPPFPNEIAYQFIEEELGASPLEIYAEISPNPVAAASLGQVYKGQLKTGETVAIKVQRPGLQESIALDVYILRQLAIWAKKNFQKVRSDLVAIMDEFAARIFEEMDYTQEGHNAEHFEQLYGNLPDIYVPKIYWEYTRTRVLTMEWINGTKLTKLNILQEKGIDAIHLVEVGVQCSLRQLLENGFFHADPHPGNLLATDDGKLAYLDFGMMSNVKPYQRYGLIEAVVHMVNRDFDALARDYVSLEFLTPDTDLTPIIPALAQVFNNALGASVAELNFKKITDEMSDLMYEYPFRVPAYYALIIRSLVTLEGIAINVDPNFKVLSKAYPYVAKRLLTDQAPELRSSLRDLLFKDGSFRWNRLENLLKNARNNPDYDLDKVINQSIDFIFSERGAFIRQNLVEELVKGLENWGRNTWDNFSYDVQTRLGFKVNHPPEKEMPQSLQHIQTIWAILQETKGFDPMKLIPVFTQLITKQETQQMGQQIANRLLERITTRFVREVLLKDNVSENNPGQLTVLK
jgi:predicted unusual protein kinase regulating ubiquinone biosynthesis (AarF/ABC1/UbiB family)